MRLLVLAGVVPFCVRKQLRRSSLRQFGDRPSQHRRAIRRIAVSIYF